jgi:hypothetical protein
MIYNRSLIDFYLNKNHNKNGNFIPFLLGRNAINYIVEVLDIDNIILPYYICPMVIKIFKSKNINVYYYEQFNDDLTILTNEILSSLNKLKLEGKSYFFWNDYLGILDDIPINIYQYLKHNNIVPIIDAIHTLPVKDYNSDIVIYGFRKLLNEPFGALLKLNKQNIENDSLSFLNSFLYRIGFYLKNKTLNLKINLFSKLDFDSNELFLYDKYQYKSLLKIHNKIDYNKICKKRKDNFIFLHENLPNKIDIDINNIKCPYGYPLMVKDNLYSRRKLWENNIHSFILWDKLYESDEIKNFKYIDLLKKSNLILPINQDLTQKELRIIIEVVQS